MELFNKIGDMVRKFLNGTSKKKLVENCLIIVIAGIILVIAGSTFFGNDGSKTAADKYSEGGEVVETVKTASAEAKQELEGELESILSEIDGTGRVDVMITYYSGKEMVPAYDRKNSGSGTEEKDSNGGTRIIQESDSEDTVVYEDIPGGGKKPVFVMEKQPEVKGVVVVAEGASAPTVKESLVRAVQALLDVPAHRVQVFERKK